MVTLPSQQQQQQQHQLPSPLLVSVPPSPVVVLAGRAQSDGATPFSTAVISDLSLASVWLGMHRLQDSLSADPTRSAAETLDRGRMRA